MSDFKSPGEAERCAQTLRNVTENAIDTEKNKILELIETVAKKMSPQMRKFLQEGAEVLHEDSNSMDRLMLYMEDSLTTLNAELNDTNFQRILDAIWLELSIILLELVQTNLDVSLIRFLTKIPSKLLLLFRNVVHHRSSKTYTKLFA